MNHNIKWHTIIKYVDLETGEVLPTDTQLKNYNLIQTKKYSYVQKNQGIVEITKLCKKATYQQPELPL